MGKSPTGKTGAQEYSGGGFFQHQFDALTGVASATGLSDVFVAPFNFNIKELLFNITDGLSATTAVVTVKRNGTAIASLSCNALATGLVDVANGFTTTFLGTNPNKEIYRGDEIQFSIPAVASFGGRGVLVGNPL